jgi:antitoxin component YwqK of YwqJK toxin-antitoxin module
MLSSKLIRTFTLGVVLASPLALAADKAPRLNCPQGTRQFGNPTDGLFCRKVEAKDGMYTPHGPYASYHTNGNKASEGQYKDGFRSGVWTYYDESGKERGKTEFNADNYHGKRVLYFPSGKPRIVEEYQNGKRHGLVQELAEDGSVVRQARYENDREVAAK